MGARIRDLQTGQVVEFIRKHQIERYGLTGVVTNVQVVVARPFGTRTTLVDITTATGVQIQWPLAQVRRDTFEQQPAVAQ